MQKMPGPPHPTSFDIRGINVCESLSRHTPQQIRRLLDRLLEWKMNTLVVLPQYGYRKHQSEIRAFCREHQINLVQYLYTFLAFSGDAPQELFAVDQTGCPHRPRMDCETRLCATDPRARSHFREGVRRYLAKSVEPGDHLLLATADGLYHCECPACRTLGAIDQWQPFLEIAVEEIIQSGIPLTTHFIAYVGRFRPPEDMGIFEKIDAVMFDTHLRHRWRPLGTPSTPGIAESFEGRNDPVAGQMPINIYLLEMLKKWRTAYRGKLYVFENLMIQACFSLPQPNTAALLEDQETFRKLGIDGVVYEAFECGMGAFEEQLGLLARGLLGEIAEYHPSELERIAERIEGGADVRTRVLEYLYADECRTPESLSSLLGLPDLTELAVAIRDYLPTPTLSKWKLLARLVLTQKENYDWIYILYRLATYLPQEERPSPRTSLQARMFATPKPWDFLESETDPQAAMQDLVQSFLDSPATPARHLPG